MFKKIFFVIIGCICFFRITAQVKGFVYATDDSGKQVPVPGAVVYWEDRMYARMTDEMGFFDIPPHPHKRMKLLVSCTGYSKDTIEVKDTSSRIIFLLHRGVLLNTAIVTGKEKTEKDDRINPLNVSLITSSGLRQAACCNLSESFENSASVDASYSDALTGARQIQMLGLAGIYTQIMTENIPSVKGVMSPFGLTYIPGPWMESIQVSKGITSVRTGYEGITGQINVEYRKPLLSKEKYFLNVFANHEGRWEANAIVNTRLNDHCGTQLMFNTNQYHGVMDHNGDGFMDQPRIQAYNFTNRWKYEHDAWEMLGGVKLLEEMRVGGQTTYSSLSPSGDTTRPYGILMRTRRQEGFVKTGYLYPLKEETSTAIILSGINHSQEGVYGMKQYEGNQQNIYINLIHITPLFSHEHRFTTGFTYQYDNVHEHFDRIVLQRTEHVPGTYAEYTFSPSASFTFMAGMRYDYNSYYGNIFTPRVHVRYEIIPDLLVKLSAGKGYRAPNVFSDNNAVMASSRKIFIEEQLHMEEAWNGGVLVQWDYTLGGRNGSIRGEYYYTHFVNQIVADLEKSTTEVHFYNLKGKSFANNYQIENEYNLFRGMDLTLAFRINDAKTTYGGILLTRPLVSRYKGFLNLNYLTPSSKWQFNYTLQYNGGGRLPSTAQNPLPYRLPATFPDYVIMNVQLSRWLGRWELYAGSENLTGFVMSHPVLAYDQPYGPYFDASLVWGPLTGRKIYGGFRYTFKE